MIKNLNKRRERDHQRNIEIDFKLNDDLLYHHKSKKRLCISANCELKIFDLTHDKSNHAKHHRTYVKLADQMYISKMSRKIRQYIKHCSTCERNQTKRHLTYEELVSMSEKISFKILTMNFIMTLSNEMNAALIVTCKAFKRIIIILEKFTWTAVNWAETLLDRLLVADWDILKEIISNKNFKFISKFWTIVFRKLSTKLLMITIYHSQTNDQFERTNQIVEIALRFFFIENSKIDWTDVVSLIQTNLNNSSNVVIELFSNKLMYDFKIRNTLFVITDRSISEQFTIFSKILDMLRNTRFRNRQETTDAVSFVNVKVKIIHDKRHKSLFLNSKKKVFLRLHKKYSLSEVINKKLSQQRCDSFTIKRRVKRLAYELDIFKNWRIHSVISITQLEFVSKNSYKRFKFDHFDFVFVEDDTENFKLYEIKRMLTKRTRQYEKIKMNQYLIRWKEYESEFDEWRNISDLKNCIDLIKDFEREDKTRSQKKTRWRKKRVNSSHQL
jgi:hypothetical protein